MSARSVVGSMREKNFPTTEGKYRDLFGIGARSLTAYEEKYFHTWATELKIPFELVKLAFDRTVEKKGKPEKHYINAILTKWHSLGLTSEKGNETYIEFDQNILEKSAPQKQRKQAVACGNLYSYACTDVSV